MTVRAFFLLPAIFSWAVSAYGQTENVSDTNVRYGSLRRFVFDTVEGEGRNVDIWLPEAYSSDNKYSVLYMHDGQNLFDGSSTWNKRSWKVDSTMQSLIDRQVIDGVIVVGVWNTRDRVAEYFPRAALKDIESPQREKLMKYMPGGPKSDEYLEFITAKIKPFVDSMFSTYPDREHTFIAGSSMGGLISLYAICEYPGIFGGAACLSTHWIGTFERNDAVPEALIRYVSRNLPDPRNHRIYFDYGTAGLDSNYPEYQRMIDRTLKQNNYEAASMLSLEFTGDDHNEDAWAARFFHPVLFLLEKNGESGQIE